MANKLLRNTLTDLDGGKIYLKTIIKYFVTITVFYV